jgi:arylsulfatase A-like enzyme
MARPDRRDPDGGSRARPSIPFLLWALASAGALSTGTTACQAERRVSTPVILVSIDTLRPDHLGCYGYGAPTSPHIDAFRKDSVLFPEAVAHAPSTLPSHASVLTSLIPPHHGASIANTRALPREIETLAEVLRARGYATASWNGGIQLDAAWGLDQGFDTYVSVKPRGASAESLVLPEDRFAHVVSLARTWLRTQGARPFFLFLHTYEVHHPYSPDAEDLAPFRAGYAGPLPDQISVDLLRRVNAGEIRLTGRDRRQIVAAYDGEIRSMDRAFGTLVAFLRENGLYDPSLIVFTSDHGEEFGEHGRMGWHNHTLFDELLRVPLLVKLPSSGQGGESRQGQARGIDVAPTILAAVGIEPPAAFEGRDLLASDGIAAEAWSERDVVAPNESVSIRTSEWKLYDTRLFDLRRDPREADDLASRRPDVVRLLRERRKQMLEARPQPLRRDARPDEELLERLRSLGYLE